MAARLSLYHMPRRLVNLPAGAKEIDECNRKGDRRKRARIEAGKSREKESDVDREMKGD